MKHITLATIVAAAFLSSACVSTAPKATEVTKPAPLSPAQIAEQRVSTAVATVPDWVINPTPDTPEFMFVAGHGMSRDLSMAIQKATLDAQAKVAGHIRADVDEFMRSHTQDLNGASTENVERLTRRLIADVQLSRGQVVQKVIQPEGMNFRVYVNMRYPAPNINRAIQALSPYDGPTAREKSLENELNARRSEVKAERERANRVAAEADAARLSAAQAQERAEAAYNAVRPAPTQPAGVVQPSGAMVTPVQDNSGIVTKFTPASPNSRPLPKGDLAEEN